MLAYSHPCCYSFLQFEAIQGIQNMKKAITIICTILSAVIILQAFNAWHAIAYFYLAGVIPGTNSTISPDVMMQVFAATGGFVLARVGNRAVLAFFDRISMKRSNQRA
jgi:hypothetical protein